MNVEAVQALQEVKRQITSLNAEVKELTKAKHKLEYEIIDELKESNLTLARTDFGTIALKETVVASVEDWNLFEKYVYDNQALYLLSRTPSNPAFREELEARGDVPGLNAFTKTTLSLTKAT